MIRNFLLSLVQLFLSCLEGIQAESLLKEIDQNKLFSNIRDICDANLKLWSLYLYPMVSDLSYRIEATCTPGEFIILPSASCQGYCKFVKAQSRALNISFKRYLNSGQAQSSNRTLNVHRLFSPRLHELCDNIRPLYEILRGAGSLSKLLQGLESQQCLVYGLLGVV